MIFELPAFSIVERTSLNVFPSGTFGESPAECVGTASLPGLKVLIPMSAGMDIVVSRCVVVVIVMRHVRPTMVIVVGRIVPIAVTAPAIPPVPMSCLPIITVPAMRAADIDMHATATEMESLGIRWLGVDSYKAECEQSRNGKSHFCHDPILLEFLCEASRLKFDQRLNAMTAPRMPKASRNLLKNNSLNGLGAPLRKDKDT